MITYGASIIGRNDNYGNYLTERATYCLNSMLMTLDEIIYVDWNTDVDKPTLLEEIKDDLIDKKKIKWIRVYPDQAKEWTWNDPIAQAVCETQSRNIGLRRLSTDFLISSNIDIVCPPREFVERFTDTNTFWTTGMRSVSLFKLRELGDRKLPANYTMVLRQLESSYPQQPPISIHHNDRFSLVSNCGDFQIAHRDVWYDIKGFEERMVGRGYADSNVQQKASMRGHNISVAWDVPVWHIGHEGGMGGSGGMNDINLAFTMPETTNPDTWGHIDSGLEIHEL